MSDAPAILVRDVRKTYSGGFEAVRGVSFEVQRGEFFGLLGPNGAGKSSLMRMLYNKSVRTSGLIEVLGFDPLKNELEIKFLSGIVPQDDNLDVDLDVAANLQVYARFYGLGTRATRARIEELLDFLELGEKKKAKIRELSGGMRRRLIIARALLNDPKLLILDEPTTGLDPQVRHLIWDKLRLLKKQGLTLMLTTHYMEEAFQLCDRLAILDHGAAVLEGRPIDLVKGHIEAYVLEIIQREASAALTYAGPVRRETIQDRVLFFSNSAAELEAIAAGLNPGDFYLRQSNLEDVFLKTTGRSIHD